MRNFGAFIGDVLLQKHATLGGAKNVFVKLQGVKNDLVFPTHGGVLKNPFKGAAKIYAGDLFEYRPDANGQKPEVYLLKTYLVKSQSGTKVVIAKDGYKHVPFAGDVLMKAPDVIGGSGKAYAVTAVAIDDNGDWELTFGTAIDSVEAGDVLVEAKAESATGEMLVKRINAVAECDYDCFYDPQASSNDFDGARYILAPCLSGLMYLGKMSPMPACVKALNQCNVNGWFKVDGLAIDGVANAGSGSAAAALEALDTRVSALEDAE